LSSFQLVCFEEIVELLWLQHVIFVIVQKVTNMKFWKLYDPFEVQLICKGHNSESFISGVMPLLNFLSNLVIALSRRVLKWHVVLLS
jgi:hypothetical protein